MFGLTKKAKKPSPAMRRVGNLIVSANSQPRERHPAGTEAQPPRAVPQSYASRRFNDAKVAELASYFADPAMLPRITKLMSQDGVTEGYDLLIRLRSMKSTPTPLIDGAL